MASKAAIPIWLLEGRERARPPQDAGRPGLGVWPPLGPGEAESGGSILRPGCRTHPCRPSLRPCPLQGRRETAAWPSEPRPWARFPPPRPRRLPGATRVRQAESLRPEDADPGACHFVLGARQDQPGSAFVAHRSDGLSGLAGLRTLEAQPLSEPTPGRGPHCRWAPHRCGP